MKILIKKQKKLNTTHLVLLLPILHIMISALVPVLGSYISPASPWLSPLEL